MPFDEAMARRLPKALFAAALLLVPRSAAPQHQSAAASPPPDAAPSRHTSTGTMAAYDADTRQLTVASASGSTAFHLASDARVWLGNRRLPVTQLKARVGAQVTVSWSEAGGVRTTHTVRLADAPDRTQ
jgi:phage baseplate assembly protein gpV